MGKRSAFKYYKKYSTITNCIYTKLRNQVKWDCKKGKREKEQMVVEDVKLTKQYVNFKHFQVFCTNRIIHLWNSLPGDVVNSDCVND